MKTDPFTEKLFLITILRCGIDIASKVLNEYLIIRDNEEIKRWIIEIGKENN